LLLVLLSVHKINGQYYFHHYDQSAGLSSNFVWGICKSDEGFIWLATSEGLDRFDGGTVMSYKNDLNDSLSLSDDYVMDICQDDDGLLWIGTLNGGINVLDPSTGKFKSYQHDPSDTTSLAFDFNKLVFKDEGGDIWTNVHDRGIDLYNRETDGFDHYVPSDSIRGKVPRLLNSILCYAPDTNKKHLLWLGSMAGVLCLDKNTGSWKHYPIEPEYSETPSVVLGKEKIIRSMAFGPGGHLWLGTWGGGLCRLDTASGKFRVYKYEGLIPVHGARNSITQILTKSQHELWVCTENKGIAVFAIETSEFDFLSEPGTNNIPVPYPSDIIVDESGNLFASTIGNGLYFTNLAAQTFIRRPMPYNLYDIAFVSDKDQFYASVTGSADKVILCDNKGRILKRFTADPVIRDPLEWVFHILNYNDEILLAGSKNMYILDNNNNWISPHPSFHPDKVNQNTDHLLEYQSVTIDREQNIWIGTKFSGIFVFNPVSGSVTNYYHPDNAVNSILFSEFIQDLYTDQHANIWYGEIDFGFFDPRQRSFINYSTDDIVPSPEYQVSKIKCFAGDSDGNIWIGTQSNGVAVIHPGDSLRLIRSINETSGLANNMVRQVMVDRNDNAWILTYDGLSCIRKDREQVENYGEDNGLTSLRVMREAPDGSIYITASGGFYHFSPGEIKSLQTWSRPYIKDIHTYTRPVPLIKVKGKLKEIMLPYMENNISVSFGMISYFKRNESRLEYMLKGLDPRWQQAGKNLSVSYASLPPGNYQFLLRTSDGGQTSLPITILPPYWRTWWFISIAFLLTAGLIYTAFTIRARQIRKQEELKASYQRKFAEQEVKALRSQMNPHFLFNSLNSIRYYVLNNENENAADYITRFSRLLRLILQNSRSDQISLKDELHALRLYIEFEQMRFNRKFEYAIDTGENVNTESILIQPLTIQPFVENAIWHGLMPVEKEGRLLVSIMKDSQYLIITVKDNGIGRERSAKTRRPNPTIIKSYGLDITQERMNLYQALRGKRSDFTIKDLYDRSGEPAGTEVKIVIEL
jgi:ligand-binding sensor domain-containing protein